MTASLVARAIGGLVFLVCAIAAILFGAAGTTHYWQAWLYVAVFAVSTLVITLSLARDDPALLERRVHAGPVAERRPRQRVIQSFAQLAFIALLVVPALDRRMAWSRVPLAVVAIGDTLVALGLLAVFRVFRANSFASATIEVGGDQRVIDTGPYARVRHPMYASALVFVAATPIALGSWLGLATVPPMVAVIIVRLLDEERVLSEQLRGYREYAARVPWRLWPSVF